MMKQILILCLGLLVMFVAVGCDTIPDPAPIYAGVKIEAHSVDVGVIASVIEVPGDPINGEMDTLTGFSFELFGLPLKGEIKYKAKGPEDEKHTGGRVVIGGRLY